MHGRPSILTILDSQSGVVLLRISPGRNSVEEKPEFTATSLPEAVRWLFQVNGYQVEGPVQINGAEIDLIAEQLTGFTRRRVYIEVTVEYVDNNKYGKDLTKLSMFRNEVGAERLIVSSVGFSLPVKERAPEAGIETFTYDQLFKSFERTQPYIEGLLHDPELDALERVYIDPDFADRNGEDLAPAYLTECKEQEQPESRWIIVIGEYGTGKTALTRMMLRRWAREHYYDPSRPIPFRIELKNFTKQFDSRSLLHDALDRGGLGHIGIEFFEAMISRGRCILLLDGYDEMAQYLTIRERRACLEALADLASGNTKGLLTSRPNYFTEAEELRVYEVLYRGIETRLQLTRVDEEIREEEARVDRILSSFVLDRSERQLRDLTPEQTEELVDRQLVGDPEGRDAVLSLLRQVTGEGDDGGTVSLSGKPVIISYLLEVVEELKQQPVVESTLKSTHQSLSEWQIFEIILEKLMLRDYRRNPDLLPAERLNFLQKLAEHLTREERKYITEKQFSGLIEEWFKEKIRRKAVEGIPDPSDMIFNDVRASSTLTRSSQRSVAGWQFSHNSLREFLLVSRMITEFMQDRPLAAGLPITSAMQTFVRSKPTEFASPILDKLAASWQVRRGAAGAIDQMFVLLWPATRHALGECNVREAVSRIAGVGLDLSDSKLYRISFSSESSPAILVKLNAKNAEMAEIDFTRADLSEAQFDGALLEAVNFSLSKLASATFRKALLWECDLTDVDATNADLRGVDLDSTGFVVQGNDVLHLAGYELLGYLSHGGAITDPVPSYFLYSHHGDFRVVMKIARYLMEEGWRQRLGIEQKGEASKNITFARSFVKELVRAGLIEEKGGVRSSSGLIRATSAGKDAFAPLVNDSTVSPELESILAKFLA